MATHLGVLTGKSHGQRSLAGYSPQGHKESDMSEATDHARMHPRVKWIVGSMAWCSVMTQRGGMESREEKRGSRGKEYMSIMADSRCGMAETNTVLYSNYPSI